jgi:hypothetical protein
MSTWYHHFRVHFRILLEQDASPISTWCNNFRIDFRDNLEQNSSVIFSWSRYCHLRFRDYVEQNSSDVFGWSRPFGVDFCSRPIYFCVRVIPTFPRLFPQSSWTRYFSSVFIHVISTLSFRCVWSFWKVLFMNVYVISVLRQWFLLYSYDVHWCWTKRLRQEYSPCFLFSLPLPKIGLVSLT